MADVLHTWREWVAELPNEASSSLAVQRLPHLPELPEPLRGSFVVHVRFSHLGSAAEGERLLAPLRAVAPVLLDAIADRPYTAVGEIHVDPPHPLPYYDRSLCLRELSKDTADAFVDVLGPHSNCPLASVEIRLLGGALDREPAVPNSVATRGIPFAVFGFGVGGPERSDIMHGYLGKR